MREREGGSPEALGGRGWLVSRWTGGIRALSVGVSPAPGPTPLGPGGTQPPGQGLCFIVATLPPVLTCRRPSPCWAPAGLSVGPLCPLTLTTSPQGSLPAAPSPVSCSCHKQTLTQVPLRETEASGNAGGTSACSIAPSRRPCDVTWERTGSLRA